jgi:hypothetical protein
MIIMPKAKQPTIPKGKRSDPITAVLVDTSNILHACPEGAVFATLGN